MSRPTKNNADWFSHDTGLRNHGVVKVARNKWGSDGYAVWAMLLEKLTDSDNFKYDLTDTELEILAADFAVDENTLKAIVDFYVKFELLQREGTVIFSQNLIDRMKPLLKKRENMRKKYDSDTPPPPDTPGDDKPPKQPPKTKSPLMTEENFAEFWAAYPKKEDKKKAQAKFLKLKQSLLPVILTAISENKVKNRKWMEGYIKNPTTWIHGENWNDEITPNQKPHEQTHPHQTSQTGKISTTGTANDTVQV